MTINGINGANTQMGQMGMNRATDSYSRNIQNQIANAQKQLQELSSNVDMALEEKMKKRQEIQQQISDLNVQLRQHQMEQRREKQQKQSSFDDMLGGTGNLRSAKEGSKSVALSQASMTAIISADTSMKQAKVQGSVATKMEDRSGVLEIEIELDKARDCDTRKKVEELADTEQKAQAATSSQFSILADASKTMEEAAKADKMEEKEKESEEKNKIKDNEEISDAVIQEDGMGTGNAVADSQSLVQYTSVDIRL